MTVGRLAAVVTTISFIFCYIDGVGDFYLRVFRDRSIYDRTLRQCANVSNKKKFTLTYPSKRGKESSHCYYIRYMRWFSKKRRAVNGNRAK